MKHIDNDSEEPSQDIVDHLNEGDFIFIIDEQGELKTVLVPEEFDIDTGSLPATVKKVFKIFGINQLTNQTLH